MAKTISISVAKEGQSWSVVDADGQIVEPIEKYLRFLRQRQDSPNTIRSYATSLSQFWTYLETRSLSWKDTDLPRMTSYMDSLRHGEVDSKIYNFGATRKISEETVAARVTAVLGFYRFHRHLGEAVMDLEQTQYVRGVKYQHFLSGIGRGKNSRRGLLRRRRTGKVPPVLTPEQLRSLITEESDVRYRFLWQLLADSGLRLGEALKLLHCDFHLGQGKAASVSVTNRIDIRGHRAKTGAREVKISGTSELYYSDLVVWLCENGADIEVENWDSLHLFCNVFRGERWEPISVNSVYAHLELRKKRNPLLPTGFTPHWLRHTHATALLLAGEAPYVVSQRLGHSSIQTTLNTYAHVTGLTEEESLEAFELYQKGEL